MRSTWGIVTRRKGADGRSKGEAYQGKKTTVELTLGLYLYTTSESNYCLVRILGFVVDDCFFVYNYIVSIATYLLV